MLIEPAVVHKNSPDDVLICEPTFVLPLEMSKSIQSLCELSTVSGVLSALYAQTDDMFALKLSEVAKKKLRLTTTGESETYFGCDAEWKRSLPYQVLNDVKEVPALTQEYLESVKSFAADLPKDLRASAFTFINDADNYFFYRKSHEHVPGTMIIEAARQAVYHHVYTNTDFVKGEVTLTLDELNSTFFAYAELMYPIEIVVDTIHDYENESPSKILCRTSFFQRGRLFSVIDSKVNAIDMSVFKKIRNIFLYADDWYKPINSTQLSIQLQDGDDQAVDVSLDGIGKRGCLTSIPDLAIEAITHFRLAYGSALTLDIPVNVLGKNEQSLMVKFEALSVEDTYTLSEIIKRAFVFMAPTPESKEVDRS